MSFPCEKFGEEPSILVGHALHDVRYFRLLCLCHLRKQSKNELGRGFPMLLLYVVRWTALSSVVRSM